MTKRPPTLIAAAALVYVYLLIFIIAMIIGASYLALSAFVTLTEGPAAAGTYFLVGVGCIGGAYLTNVVLTFLFTKKWSWRLTTKVELTPVPKQKKK